MLDTIDELEDEIAFQDEQAMLDKWVPRLDCLLLHHASILLLPPILAVRSR